MSIKKARKEKQDAINEKWKVYEAKINGRPLIVDLREQLSVLIGYREGRIKGFIKRLQDGNYAAEFSSHDSIIQDAAEIAVYKKVLDLINMQSGASRTDVDELERWCVEEAKQQSTTRQYNSTSQTHNLFASCTQLAWANLAWSPWDSIRKICLDACYDELCRVVKGYGIEEEPDA